MSEPRRVLITGVSRGLGRAMALGMRERGHTVIGCSRDQAAVARLVEEFGGPHSFAVVDVADDRAVANWAQRVLAEVGPPDLLINNAALINRNAPLWEVPAEELDRVVQVNVCGVTNVLRHFLPAMIEAGRGVAVNLSSGWGRSTSPEVAPYCATKWAVEGLTQALASELPRGLAAIALNPGVINTEMLVSCYGEGASDYPDPQEWAERAVPYLLGLGPGENGQALTVPGG